jgi:hypothetical protein
MQFYLLLVSGPIFTFQFNQIRRLLWGQNPGFKALSSA